MKIDGNIPGGISPEPIQKPATAPPGAGGETTGAEASRKAARIGYRTSAESSTETEPDAHSDQVTLSGLGRELSRLTKAADKEREAKIEKLAGQYEQGTLKQDTGQLARKLVDDAFGNE